MKTPIYPTTLLYDGSAAYVDSGMDGLCARDVGRRLRFEDNSPPGFDAARWGATAAELDALLHAVDADGRTWRGVPALRLAYSAVGLGRAWAATAWPLLAPLVVAGYAWFAQHRRGISRVAAPLIEHIAAARVARRMQRCTDGQRATARTRRPS